MTSKTRPTLLERLRDGADVLSWEDFFRRYGRLLYVAARQRRCSEHTAEEIVQEVLLAVFENREAFRYDPGRGRFRDWLGALVRNKVAQHRRGPARRLHVVGASAADAGVLDPADEQPPADQAWEAAFERALLAVLLDVVRREINPRSFQAFELTTLEGLSGEEAAAVVGTSRNAVYLARRKVLRRLRELGSGYRQDGQLVQRVKEALESLPAAAAQRSLSRTIQKTMPSREEPPS